MQVKADPRQMGRQMHTLDPSVCAGMSYKKHGSSLGGCVCVCAVAGGGAVLSADFIGAVLHFQL